MKGFLHYLEQTIIVVLHLVLLAWMIFVLYRGGQLTMKQMIMHFTGMALYGAFLIRGTAYLVQRKFHHDQSS